jgi:long-chain acyl-CoA synthetase
MLTTPPVGTLGLGWLAPELRERSVQSAYPGYFALTRPDHPACIMAGSGQALTYADLDAGSNRLAQLFRAAGLDRGAHVAILLENHPRFFEVAWAAQRAGLHYTAISSRLSGPEAAFVVADCGARALVTSARLAGVAAEVATAVRIPTRLMLDGTVPGYDSYESLVDGLPATALPDESEGSDMLYTGGTTGRPRGVKRELPEGPMGQPLGVTGIAQLLFGFDERTVYLSPAPLYHAAPLRFCMAVHRLGGTVVVMDHFDAGAALAAIEAQRVTHSQWVPTMFVRMLQLPAADREARDLSSHACAIHAAAPCSPEVKRQMIAWWGPILQEYCGGTEGTGLVHCDSAMWLDHPGTVGRPVLGRLHICDDQGRELPAGQAGLVYYSEAPDFEYHNDPGKTAESRHPSGNGWRTIGDIGYVDPDGFLFLVDRRGFTIVSGGVNVYPQEVENVLAPHPAVADVAVFGVPNQDLGEEVKAVVQPVAGAVAGPELEAELMAYCRERLSHVKCPRSIDFREQLPREPTGKLRKGLLRDEYWAGRATRIGN